jgi:hypothetical protein
MVRGKRLIGVCIGTAEMVVMAIADTSTIICIYHGDECE